MATTSQAAVSTQRIRINYQEQPVTSLPVWKKLVHWCDGQQQNRLLWLGIALTGHGAVLTPLTVIAVLMSGAYFPLVVLALVAMGMALVTNLAALPTKITIPVFALSMVIDLAILITCLVNGIHISQTYL